MRLNNEWKDYQIYATGDGEKLERWKDVVLLRPDPQAIWHAKKPLCAVKKPDARYLRSSTGGGHWEFDKKLPESWVVSWRNLNFTVRPMNFKHTGLFPEQAANWATMIELIRRANRPISVLNLFAYTGGATVACLSAGASVCHVDAAKNMVEVAKQNVALSNLSNAPVRYIVDDCRKFVAREIKRGHKYDAIVLDPPSFGRGANGEEWKLERDICDFLSLCAQVLSENPLFVLLNSYTTGLQPAVLSNLLGRTIPHEGKIVAYEVCFPTDEKTVLPCGASGLFVGANVDSDGII
ncbi:MAG: class I SAM-dependent methyltransferase [Candidatus Fimimonas sp.]